jgi:hypothetical protein
MKRNQLNLPAPKDTPSTRKRRLQQRLQEISERSELEMAALIKSVEKLKDGLRAKQ